MAALVKSDKPEFRGRDAWLRIKDQPPRQLISQFTIETEAGDQGADAWGGEAIFRNGEYAGRITSGSYSFTFNTSVALGYVNADQYAPGEEYEVAILGAPHKARLLAEPLFDPKGARLRG